MDLYLFASHPTPEIREKAGRHVGQGEEGNRIRTRVDFAFGSAHAMYAIEAADLAAAAVHHSALAASGATTQYSLMSCTTPDCQGQLPAIPPVHVWPSWLPPFEILGFTMLWLERAVSEWPQFESPGIAAAIEAGCRKVLIEFGGSSLEQIQADICRLGDLPEVARLETHFAVGSGSAD